MEDLVSVIVPVYNVQLYLEECVNSIINQTYKNIEILLIDDDSTDNSLEICKKLEESDDRICIFHKEKNEGLGYARNTGLSIAKGKFVMFVDSDDYINKEFIETLMRYINEKKVDTVFCGFNKVLQNGKIINFPAYYNDAVFKNKEIIDCVLLEMIGSLPDSPVDYNLEMSVWHAIYSKKIIDKFNIKFVSERVVMSEDIAFHIDYLRRCSSIYFTNKCLYNYRYNGNSLSRIFNIERFQREKKLFQYINSKLSEFLAIERFQVREDRRLLAAARGQIQRIINSKCKNKKKNVCAILKDSELKMVLDRYPINENPLSHKLFNLAMYNKCYYIIYILVILKKLIYKR